MVHTGLDLGCPFEDVPTNARETRASFRKPRGKLHFRHIGYFLTIFFVMIQMASGQSVPSDNSTLPDKPEPSDQSYLAYPANRPYQTASADLADPNNPTDPADQQPHRPRVVQQSGGDFYRPITPGERLQWLITSTLGPSHLLAGTVVAGIRTAEDHPVEYGTHWGGFADRFGMRMSGIATGNTMEAGLGYLLGEDPRYFRIGSTGGTTWHRVGYALTRVFVVRTDQGKWNFNYSEWLGIASYKTVGNLYHPGNSPGVLPIAKRSGINIGEDMGWNVLREFWPEIVHKFHLPFKNRQYSQDQTDSTSKPSAFNVKPTPAGSTSVLPR